VRRTLNVDNLEQLWTGQRVFGDPIERPDGTTIIPVSHVQDGREASAVGIFVIRPDKAQFVPAVDATRIALLGVGVGLAATVLGMIAVIHRPPWPDIRLRR
jgi:uncharacterized spore protein YtfJ